MTTFQTNDHSHRSLQVRISASKPQSANRPPKKPDIHTIPESFLAITAFFAFSIQVSPPRDITLRDPTMKICSVRNLFRRLLKSLVSMPFILAIIFIVAGCAVVNKPASTCLRVRMVDATSNKARYIARSPAGSLIEVNVAREPYRQSLHGLISMDGAKPSTVLSRFWVSIDGSEVIVPAREYAGLGAPHIGAECGPIKIEHIVPDRFYVYISGGDGAGGYEQRLVFSNSNWLRTEYRDSETWEFFTEQTSTSNGG
jgi:hypothetical protein